MFVVRFSDRWDDPNAAYLKIKKLSTAWETVPVQKAMASRFKSEATAKWASNVVARGGIIKSWIEPL